MSKCKNVQICKYENMQMCRCANLKMRRCEVCLKIFKKNSHKSKYF